MEITCLNSEARANWVEAYSIWLGTDDIDDSLDLFSAMGDVTLLMANVTKCDIRRPWKDIDKFCKSKTFTA